jgi:hypothetical protein
MSWLVNLPRQTGQRNQVSLQLLARNDEIFQAIPTAKTGRIQIGVSTSYPVE